jgi:polyhydroxyalkanoic acid synthase PhaR subunit
MAQQATSDPFGMWREWVTRSEQQWNSFFNDVMATEEFGQSMGTLMDLYVNFTRSMGDSMARYLTALNIPTRHDVLAIGDRLSALEERLASIEDALRATAATSTGGPAGADLRPMPPRTRKPPRATN